MGFMKGGALRERLEEWKTRLDCRVVARSLGLAGRGSRWFCPSCQPDGGRTPDLAAEAERFRCFKCGAGGDAIALVRLATGLPFAQAVEWLEQRFAAPLERERNGPKGTGSLTRPRVRTNRPSLRERAGAEASNAVDLSARAMVFERFRAGCRDPRPGDPAWTFLVERSIRPEAFRRLRVGWLANGGELADLMARLTREWDEPTLIRAGLWRLGRTRTPRTGGPVFRPYGHLDRPILVLPYPWNGRLVHLKVRALIDSSEAEAQGIPRFLSAAGSIPCPYHADALVREPTEETRRGTLWICEGETDTLAALSRGWRAIGVPGWSGFKAGWIARIKGTFRAVRLAMDGDEAGARGAADIAAKFRRAGAPAPRLLPPRPGHDLGDRLRAPNAEALRALLDRLAARGWNLRGRLVHFRPAPGVRTGRLHYPSFNEPEFPEAPDDPRLANLQPVVPGRLWARCGYVRPWTRILCGWMRRQWPDQADALEEDLMTTTREADLIAWLEGRGPAPKPLQPHTRSLLGALGAPRVGPLRTLAGRPLADSSNPSGLVGLERILAGTLADLIHRAALEWEGSLEHHPDLSRHADLGLIWFDRLWVEFDPNAVALDTIAARLRYALRLAARFEGLAIDARIET